MSKFNKGDKVRVKNGNAEGLEGVVFGHNSGGLSQIKTTNSGSNWAFSWHVGFEGHWTDDRLTLLESGADRTHLEGKVIDYRDVKVGDRILVTYTEDAWGQVTTVEGVVDVITTASNGATIFKTKKEYTSSIFMSNWDMVKDITLVKAAVPEPTDAEKLLEKFKEAKHNQVIQYGLLVARKFSVHGQGSWYVLDGSSFKSRTSGELVESFFQHVRVEDVTFFPRKSN